MIPSFEQTGTSIRLLSTVTPDELKDKVGFRYISPSHSLIPPMAPNCHPNDVLTTSTETKTIRQRLQKIYGSNPLFNPQATVDACPDYAFVIRGPQPLSSPTPAPQDHPLSLSNPLKPRSQC
jgi:hypothetical protein